MHYFDLYSSYPDHTIVTAWDSQVKESNKTPWLADTLTRRSNELFPRFAVCYAELRVLPRGARRALQRQLARSSELSAFLPEYVQQGGRRLQHRMAWSLAGAALLLALSQGTAAAATITVTTNDPNIVSDGQCSLVEAIVNANNDAATHADCVAGSGADTIVLPPNANVTLSNANAMFYGPIGLPLITSRITIEGNGAIIARQGNAPAFGLMAVSRSVTGQDALGDLTLHGVTLSGGFSGVYNSFGTLTIENSTISGNSNSSGVRTWGGTTTIINSTISGNTSTRGGGGVYNTGYTTSIINSTISGNTSTQGGGVFNYGGSLTIINSTISGNHANQGGGVFNSAYYAFIPGCCPGTVTLNRSLIAGNQAAVGPEIENATTMPLNTVTANNFNLFGADGNAGVTGFTPRPNDIVPSVSLAQILGPLQNNGGPTQTHALVAGSPAINAGDPTGCRDDLGALLLTDQRGFARHVDGNNDGTIRCDIGAFEFGAESVPIPSPLTIGATTIATGEVGVSFTSDLLISGGVAPYVVSITRGRLPQGLSLGNDGIISGTPSPTARTEKITVRITDSVNDSITQTLTITVLRALHIANKAKAGRVGRDYSASLRSRGGLGPFNWSITSGVLPPGLSLNNATGALTGVPTQVGEFPLTVQVTDALGGVAVEALTLKIR